MPYDLEDRQTQSIVNARELLALNVAISGLSAIGLFVQAGYIHCDIKPANMMVRGDGHPEVT
jgi:serine/threonine protein kinase